jgi:hypothetical protein
MTAHAGDLLPIRDDQGRFGHLYATTCTCGWTSPERARPGEANADLADHLRTLRPHAKD